MEPLTVLYSKDKLTALLTNIMLRWWWQAVKNTLTYYDTLLLKVVKMFMIQTPC